MSNKVALVILAAGVGSRYGKVKQLDSMTKYDNQIIDFTIFDAIEAGFSKLYLVIQKQHEELFNEKLVKYIKDKIEVEYVYQSVPEHLAKLGRVKPLGTSHALYSCKNQVKEPFVLCNADDYYGKEAFKTMYSYLSNKEDDNACMVGYLLKNTLSKNGSVSRAVCLSENGKLKKIKELLDIKYENNEFEYSLKNEISISLDTVVSMNFWGFTKNIFEKHSLIVEKFIDEGIYDDLLKKECLLPNDIQQLINEKQLEVEVFTSNDKWMGVTYPDDRDEVVKRFVELIEGNQYPENLWNK